MNHLNISAIPLKITFWNIDKKQLHIQLFIFFIFYFFHFDFKGAIKYTAISSKYLYFLWKPFFPGSDIRPTQVGTWILYLSHDPIWAIWLAEVRKFNQHYDWIGTQLLPWHAHVLLHYWLSERAIHRWLVDSSHFLSSICVIAIGPI